MPRRRRPWLAGFWSLVCPGLGQLSNGRFDKAAAFALGIPLAAIPLYLAMTACWLPPFNIALPVATLIGTQVWSAIDATREARRLLDVPVAPYARWFVCAGLWVLHALVLVPQVTKPFLQLAVQAFKITNGGMTPTLLIGDHLLVDMTAYGVRLPVGTIRPEDPRRGDIVVFLFPEDPTRSFVKRVIGLPGETLRIQDRTVLVNEHPLTEPYARFLGGADHARDDFGPVTVPAGSVFVLGDNRDNSRDSRYWGFLPLDMILGQAGTLYYSWDGQAHRGRWDRMGQEVR